MRRLSLAPALFALFALALPASSYAQQSIGFSVGAFVPRAEQSRDTQDVLWNNLDFLSFNTSDFNGATAGAEYVVGLGDFLDAGLGGGVYSKSVPSVYSRLVSRNGSEIEQDLRLRMVPFTATVRYLPLGRSAGIEPYIGAGVAVINWRYNESGDFVDFTDSSIFTDEFTAKGTATGPTVLGGVLFPMGNWSVGGEIRWQKALGDLPADLGFAGTKVDLGGVNYQAVFRVRF
ncbi:MAG: hypothetical protein U0Q55_03930 [Vicinamibacterales bacterium]